jgi:glutathione synthase/RimK-type ligase-like ATP-grasp enzyme
VILVLSHSADDHAVGVLDALDRAGHPAVLMDTSQFPVRASLTQRFEGGCCTYQFAPDGDQIDLAACRVGWWRRPQPFSLHPGISPDVVSFTYSECNEAMTGLWAALDLIWVNPPQLDEVAHHKPYQLAAATAVGLPIPRTLITNSPDEAHKLITELGPEHTVYKTFLASEQCWRETRIVRPGEVEMLDFLRLAPAIFQEYIPAVADIRATVVGSKIFSAAIYAAKGGYHLDYRMDMRGATFEPTHLSPETEQAVFALMKRLGLVFGAVDLRRTRNRGDIFLEINPAGEWRFIEERTGQPITRAVAELLAGLDNDRISA